jgi:hypothetical protein
MSVLRYELWDMESANRIGVFDSKREALNVVQEIFEDYGRSAVQSLGLGAIICDESGNVDLEPAIDGEGLVSLIEGSVVIVDEPADGGQGLRPRRAAS